MNSADPNPTQTPSGPTGTQQTRSGGAGIDTERYRYFAAISNQQACELFVRQCCDEIDRLRAVINGGPNCIHGWEDSDGNPAPCYECLAAEAASLRASLDSWQQTGNAIMLAVCGREAPLSDADVIGEVERLRAGLRGETLAELALRSASHNGTSWLCGRHPDEAIAALRVCGQSSIEDAAADLVQMLSDEIDRLRAAVDAWRRAAKNGRNAIQDAIATCQLDYQHDLPRNHMLRDDWLRLLRWEREVLSSCRAAEAGSVASLREESDRIRAELQAEIDRLRAERRNERPASIPCPREQAEPGRGEK